MRETPLLIGAMLLLVACGGKEPGADSGDTDATAEELPFDFATEGPDAYERVDRLGMPAIGTAVITSKDSYNLGDPEDDLTGTWVEEITANVTGLHDALDDDLTALGLTPCLPADCVAAAAPLVVPDTLTLDPSAPNGFPNGRLLTDPVVDVTLSLVLLDLTVHGVTDLVGVNPTENDVPFSDEFPYLSVK